MAKKNVEMGERKRTNVDSKRLSTASIPSLSAPEELQLSLRPAPDSSAATTTTTVVAVVEKQPEEEADDKAESSQEPKKGVKFTESTKKTRAPQIGEIKKQEEEKSSEGDKEEEGGKIKEEESEKVSEKVEAVPTTQVQEVRIVKESSDINKDELKKVAEISKGSGDIAREVLPEKEKEEEVEEKKENDKESTIVVDKKECVTVSEEEHSQESKDVNDEPIGESRTLSKEEGSSPYTDNRKTEEVQAAEGHTERVDKLPEPGRITSAAPEAEPQPSQPKVEYVYRKAPNPPFMSTALLQPMKAEIPKPKRVEEDIEAQRENLRKSEELRELEEELLGEKKTKVEKVLEGDIIFLFTFNSHSICCSGTKMAMLQLGRQANQDPILPPDSDSFEQTFMTLVWLVE